MSEVPEDDTSEGEGKRKLLEGLGHALYLTRIKTDEGYTTTLELLDEEKGEAVFSLVGTGDSKDEGLQVDFKMSEEEMLRFIIRILEALGAKRD